MKLAILGIILSVASAAYADPAPPVVKYKYHQLVTWDDTFYGHCSGTVESVFPYQGNVLYAVKATCSTGYTAEVSVDQNLLSPGV